LDISDAGSCGWNFHEFKRLMDSFESSGMSDKLEPNQASYFKEAFIEVIEEVRELYDKMLS
jgi:hypothetical protein